MHLHSEGRDGSVIPRRTLDHVAVRVDQWRKAQSGHRIVISFQTQAEVLAGAYSVGWGTQRISIPSRVLPTSHRSTTV